MPLARSRASATRYGMASRRTRAGTWRLRPSFETGAARLLRGCESFDLGACLSELVARMSEAISGTSGTAPACRCAHAGYSAARCSQDESQRRQVARALLGGDRGRARYLAYFLEGRIEA